MAICYIGGMKKDRLKLLKNNIKQIGKKFWKLTEVIVRNKKDAAIALVCVVLVIVAVVSIIKIVNLHSAEIKQEQEIQTLQEEYISEAGDSSSMSNESDMVAKSGDLETDPEDDPNAWYHDIDVELAGLKEHNEDIVGWIYFEDEESISYPLLYSGDDYYLRRNYLKEEETAGSIYIDGNNKMWSPKVPDDCLSV